MEPLRRRGLWLDDDRRPDFDPIIEPDDVRIAHAHAAVAHGLPQQLRFRGAMLTAARVSALEVTKRGAIDLPGRNACVRMPETTTAFEPSALQLVPACTAR